MHSDSDFDTFWAAYPRKVARAYALKIWTRLTDSEKFAAREAIAVHARHWQSLGTAWDKIPHASTWLNGERWADELEMPEPKADEWWKSEAGIMREGLKRGIRPRPGESMQDFRARVQMTRAA